jgi:hypothetical protein
MINQKMKIQHKFCRFGKKEIEENIAAIAEAVSKPKYICQKCARVSRKKKDLCKPRKLPSR